MRLLFFVICITILIIIWKNYWKYQLPYILNEKTPEELFGVNKNFKRIALDGFSYMSGKKIVICSLLRDVEHNIQNIIHNVESLGNLFLDYRFIVVENDSTDRTREKLLDWSYKNNKILVLGCGRYTPQCHMNFEKTVDHSVTRNRIDKMTILRNIYLEEVRKNYSLWDYAIVWDLDIVGKVYSDGVANSFAWFAKNNDISMICSYGIYNWPGFTLFYDTYAYLHKSEKFHVDTKTLHDIRKGIWEVKYNLGEPLVEVDSCFSGFAIYKIRDILDKKYIFSDRENLYCEHVLFNLQLPNKKFLNPSMIYLVLKND